MKAGVSDHKGSSDQKESGVGLAPFYDLVSTMAYPELAQKFAMAIGKTFRFDRVAEHSWKQFSADMNVRFEKLQSLMAEVRASLIPAVEPLAAEHERQYGASPIYEAILRIAGDGLKRLERIIEGSGKASAMEMLQSSMEGKAEKAGLRSDEDVLDLVKEPLNNEVKQALLFSGSLNFSSPKTKT
jgi:hypothetical protein